MGSLRLYLVLIVMVGRKINRYIQFLNPLFFLVLNDFIDVPFLISQPPILMSLGVPVLRALLGASASSVSAVSCSQLGAEAFPEASPSTGGKGGGVNSPYLLQTFLPDLLQWTFKAKSNYIGSAYGD